MIHFLVPAGQELIEDYLNLGGRELAPRCRILDYESLPGRTSFEPGTYVLTSLDRLSPAQERLLGELHRRLAGVEGFRFLNDPVRTLGRLELLEALARRGMNDFRAVRATADYTKLRYPVFVRSERLHDGALSPLIHSPKKVASWIGRALFKGYRLHDLIVVEFCETVGADGFYRRFAAFVVGERVIPRGLERGRVWMAKRYQTEFSLELALEERDFVLTSPHADQLSEIFEIAGIEYGRIDYAVKGGRIRTWEINVAPTIGQGRRGPTRQIPKELKKVRDESKNFFYSRFREAWEAVDLPSDGRPPVPIAWDAAGARAANPPAAIRKRWAVRLVEILQPVMPALLALARPFFPLVGRVARAAARRR